MELDDLKHTWQQTNLKKISNFDIMELIQHKSYGPIAALKRAYIRQIRLMTVIPVMLLLTSINDVSSVLTSIMFWSYVAFCLAVISFSFYNYRIVGKMEGMDALVRSNLEQQIDLLEKRMRWIMIGLRITLLYFILLAEIIPYFQHYRMLDKWHVVNPFIRYGLYAIFLILQYFVSSKISDRKFGKHLRYLKELAKEMQY